MDKDFLAFMRRRCAALSGPAGMRRASLDLAKCLVVFELVKVFARDHLGGATFTPHSALPQPRFRHRSLLASTAFLPAYFVQHLPITPCTNNNPPNSLHYCTLHHTVRDNDIIRLHERACEPIPRLRNRHRRPCRYNHRHPLLSAYCCRTAHMGLWAAVAVCDLELGVYE